MVRWQPGAQERLKQAALELFEERGYDATTVAEIAERAGLTRRTFFRYFGDKREVLFVDPGPLYSYTETAIADADAELGPADVMFAVLTEVGERIADIADQPARRRVVISASPELREREQQKLIRLTAAVSAGLVRRGLATDEADLLARVGLAIFGAAWDRWAEETTAAQFSPAPFSSVFATTLQTFRSLPGLFPA